MANRLGGDTSAFERDPEDIATEQYLKSEVRRLQKELAQAHKGRSNTNGDGRGHGGEIKTVDLINAKTVTPIPYSWQWNGFLAAGKLHALAGSKGTGKTTIALDLAARITAGQSWPDGTACATKGSVLIWSGEDDFDDTLLPRFLAAGGDPDLFWHVKDTIVDGKHRPFDPAYDVPQLLAVAKNISDLKMTIVDPFVSAVAGNSHQNAETRRGLTPLVSFTSESKSSMIGLTHFTKWTAGRDPIERLVGSLAFGAVPRLVMVTAKPLDVSRKLRLVRAESNIGPSGDGFEYSKYQEPLTGLAFAAQRIAWGDHLEGTARDLLNDVEMPKEADVRPAPRRDMATDFLQAILKDGPAATNKIKADAAAAGIAWRTVERAAKDLGVSASRVGGIGDKGEWKWWLPDDVPPGAEVEL
jgi:putative DNA primase/helicase